MRLVAAVAAVFAVAAISVGGTQTAHAESQQTSDKEPVMVTVERGDSLSKIGKRYDTTYQRIFYANTEIENPDLIFPGQELRIPDAEEELEERPIPSSAQAPTRVTKATAPRRATAPRATTRVRTPAPAPAATVPSGGVWDSLAQCESGGNWSISTGNGYYGGLQFSLSSWRAVGGQGYPHQASKAEQIARAQALQAIQGWGAWPACTAKLGIR